MKMKQSTLYAILAILGLSAYLYQRKKEGGTSGPIKGVDLSLNPIQIVEGAIGAMNMHPLKKEALKHTARRMVESYMSKGFK
jgi:hypothetical protein